ncbi:TPA: ABC transporter permease [Candidatus Bathyarchaeota archaeon]|nr:ABC transporter permease [Candidatus Bathyarchaeota archaeon]
MSRYSVSRPLASAIGDLSRRKSAALYITLTGCAIVVSIVVIALLAHVIAPYDPTVNIGDPLLRPGMRFLMGTDILGRDVYSRILYGSRTSLLVVFTSTVLSLMAGVPIGLVSGYLGGKLDRVASLIMDSIYAFPGLVLAIAIAAVLGPGVTNMAIAIAVVYIPMYFRMVRSQVLSLKEGLFVEAARAIGARDRTIMLRYIFPNVTFSIAVIFSLNVVDAILTEAALSFFGLGVTAPTPDWGFDLRAGQSFLLSGYWWLITFPGLMIILTAIGFSLLGEGLNEMLTPKLREV